MAHVASELTLRYRRHALAALDGLIAQADSDARQRRLALERVAAGSDTAGVRARLRFATDRLALLHLSRSCLLSGGPLAKDVGDPLLAFVD
jgi:hypothetical protein